MPAVIADGAPERRDVADRDRARAAGARDLRGHQADRAGPGDEDRAARGDTGLAVRPDPDRQRLE
jgi:hypothetical protein